MTSAAVEDFLAATLDRHIDAERSLHSGDLAPRLETWSHKDPVTLFGAGVTWRSGWDEVRPVFEWLTGRFAGCEEYDFELITAGVSGELAYVVGIERYTAITAAGTALRNELRATHIYRLEAGEWKVIHRHGDHMPEDLASQTT